MAKKPARQIPDLSNATPEFLVAEIRKARDLQADGKFYEGIYKERLRTFDGWDTKKMDATIYGDYVVEISTSPTERIDVEAVRALFTREELIEKKLLIAPDVTQLRINPKPTV